LTNYRRRNFLTAKNVARQSRNQRRFGTGELTAKGAKNTKEEIGISRAKAQRPQRNQTSGLGVLGVLARANPRFGELRATGKFAQAAKTLTYSSARRKK
jgi:hypothetical protein